MNEHPEQPAPERPEGPPVAGGAGGAQPGSQAGAAPSPPPPTSAAAPRPPLAVPPRSGWYNGPFPPPGWSGRESIGRSMLRALAVCAVAVLTIGTGFFLLVVGGFIALIVFAALAGGGLDGGGSSDGLGATKFVYGAEQGHHKLLLIEVNGPILGEEAPGTGWLNSIAGVTYGYDVKREFEKAAKDRSIDGVVLELNTPGGTIFGAHAIADGVQHYKETTGKPVLAFVAGLSASGGMWSMAPATKILADYGSLVGSIGVILGPLPYYDKVTATDGGILGGGVTTQNGIEYTYITAGRGKDMGSPYRRLTDEERSVLQKGMNNTYDEFVRHVAKSRNISEQTIRDGIGALIYDNATAQSLGLIDGTASRQEAFAEAARLANLPAGDWRVVRRRSSGGFLSGIVGEAQSRLQTRGQARPAACFTPLSALVYYGDPSALACQGR